MTFSRLRDGLFALAVMLLWIGSPSVAEAEGPERPAELKVLDRLVGSWSLEEIERQANGDEKRNTAILNTTWSLQDRYLEVRGLESDGKKQESLNLWTYDANAGVYKMWMFVWNYTDAISVTWRWNEPERTLEGAGGGNRLQMMIRFVNKDSYVYTATAKDESGKVLVETKGKVVRRK